MSRLPAVTKYPAMLMFGSILKLPGQRLLGLGLFLAVVVILNIAAITLDALGWLVLFVVSLLVVEGAAVGWDFWNRGRSGRGRRQVVAKLDAKRDQRELLRHEWNLREASKRRR